MKTEVEITNKTIRLKEILETCRKPYILYVGCVILGLVILIFAFRPLIIKSRMAANDLSRLQSELLSQRVTIDALENLGAKTELIQQNDVPLTIVEVTEKGRELGINFSSISPGQLQQTTQPSVGKLPISFMIESEYKNLGQLLIYIEEFFHSVAEVKSILIQPSKENLSGLTVELVLNLYVETEDEA